MQGRNPKLQTSKRLTLLALTLVAGLTALVSAPAAGAAPFVEATDGQCPVAPLEQPFMGWLDSDYYVLIPDGDFENGASNWTLDGAGVVSGNEPYHVHGADDSSSVSIASGGSATSDTTCVGIQEPTLRLFVRSSAASLTSRLKVEVVFEDTQGNLHARPMGDVSARDATSWIPTEPMLIGANRHPLLEGKMPVKFRFTAQGAADWQIDDVYVDPRYY